MRSLDFPPEWEEVDHELCGLSWPSDQPWTNMSSCCAGEVKVSNGCWQYCEPLGSRLEFHSCAFASIANVSGGGTDCNGIERNAAGRTGAEGGVVGSVLMLWALVNLMR